MCVKTTEQNLRNVDARTSKPIQKFYKSLLELEPNWGQAWKISTDWEHAWENGSFAGVFFMHLESKEK